MTPELYKVSEVAALARVHRQTIYNWIAQGRLPVVRIGTGRSLRIPAKAVSDMLTRADADGTV